MFFWPTDKCKSQIHSFKSAFRLHLLLREISGSLAAKCSTVFSSVSGCIAEQVQ